MIGFSLTIALLSILFAFVVVLAPVLFVLEFFGITDILGENDSSLDDHIKECKREHPSNFKG